MIGQFVALTRFDFAMDFFEKTVIGQQIQIVHRIQGFERCFVALSITVQRLLVR